MRPESISVRLKCNKTPPRRSRVADQYIVVFKPGVVLGTSGHRIQDIASAVQSRHGGKTIYQYAHALHGLAMKLSPSERDSLSTDTQVAYIVPDGIATAITDETNATWGLDRIDQRQLPLNQTYSYSTDGTGVHAYIIDTGINATHTEFGGGPGGSTRVGLGYDFVDNDNDPTDCYGHGTHVAGTIGGTTYGVAKQVTLHAVRVLDCSGSGAWSTVIAGIDWVTANHVGPAVANMSLGGGFNQAINDAVTNSIASGVTYAIAAGNSSDNACSYSPASTPNALTVGATDSTDTRASFSNYGTCVDVFAPGYSITSAWIGSDTATNTISGTSMATPHVAGVAALYLGLNPSASPSQVAAVLTSRATLNAVLNPGTGSPNRLLYMGNLAAPVDQVPPTATITSPTDGQTVSGSVPVSVTAADDVGSVTSVELYVNGVLTSTDTAAPWAFSWDSGAVSTGTYQLTVIATDDSGNRGTSAPVSVSVNNPGQAVYDAVLKAPVCGTVGNNCSTGALVNGRGTLGELNTPNTLLSSCSDGNSGTYH
jgi:subtilisin family serine protease